MTFSLRTDRQLIRAGASSTRYVLVSFVAPDVRSHADRLPVTISLILDKSGSMDAARKFELAHEAVAQSLRLLNPEDRFSLVVYDYSVVVLMPSVPATPESRTMALDVLRGIEPCGATNLSGGWLRGCEQIADHLRPEEVARALLLTDGLANQGITDHAELVRHASELRARGIATSTFGVGTDFDETLLRDMAHEGGGNFYFIETPAQIPDLLTSELGETLEISMRGVVLDVALPPGATARTLNRYRTRPVDDRHALRVDLGDLVSGQDVRIVLQIDLPPGDLGERATTRIALTGEGTNMERSEGVVSWTYASHAENEDQKRDLDVYHALAPLIAARARAEATEANRHGHLSRAREVLEDAMAQIGGYANGHPAMLCQEATLREEAPQFTNSQMSPGELKAAMFAAEAQQKGRDTLGKVNRKR